MNFVETPIYDVLVTDWKKTHDGREPGDVVEDSTPTRSKPQAPRAAKAPRRRT